MNNIDNKTTKIIASILHSKTIVLNAPTYVVTAMQRWVEELEEIPSDTLSGFNDNVSVSDSATLELKNEGNLN